MLVSPLTLRRRGILGINARNHALVQPHNRRERFPLVDNKRLTKLSLERWDIPTPPHLGLIEHHGDIGKLDQIIEGCDGFVTKPCNGAGGKGILVIEKSDGDGFVRSGGRPMTRDRVLAHIANTISGLHSLTGRPDAALIEDRIVFSHAFNDFTYKGVPDIRLIVYRGYPLVAMMRLPTRSANGKANLHQGAVGVGIDLNHGNAVKACRRNRPVDRHPDTGVELAKLQVPQWHDCLLMATRCADMCQLGYLGADIVLDAERGPMVIELNARPGLSIQLANGVGLRKRLAAIDDLPQDPLPSPEERVRLAKDAVSGI